MAAMITYTSSLIYLLSLMVLLFSPFGCCSDSDPLQDFCVAELNGTLSINGFPCKPISKVRSSDFFFDGFTKEGNTSNGVGSAVTSGNVLAFPGVNTLGISMNRVDFAPGGVNPPHIHPRASETGVIIRGEVLVGFITTGNVYHSKVLKFGEMFVIPRGLAHFQMNVGKGKAMVITAFNSQLPGTTILSLALFASNPPLPIKVLTKTFQVEEKVINDIKSKFIF
ncbi:hypothetical protein GIB67_004088 [Kingdonia uniflora]|uniref:Germin-like protein n=1 Tax=Kingdonia uniflora TaxID=39325 RepID=A0A7J7NR88_9MAGN|nr:hypothetical protein GIB67_004084 [Kingdonia uniflora]KAF6169695.1 hypothetical protein GIB67_004087 [Kingdonia uniflora]KAF6169696.1 hypothetical protein GIB67_004088 [Kingdonia uniflora]